MEQQQQAHSDDSVWKAIGLGCIVFAILAFCVFVSVFSTFIYVLRKEAADRRFAVAQAKEKEQIARDQAQREAEQTPKKSGSSLTKGENAAVKLVLMWNNLEHHKNMPALKETETFKLMLTRLDAFTDGVEDGRFGELQAQSVWTRMRALYKNKDLSEADLKVFSKELESLLASEGE